MSDQQNKRCDGKPDFGIILPFIFLILDSSLLFSSFASGFIGMCAINVASVSVSMQHFLLKQRNNMNTVYDVTNIDFNRLFHSINEISTQLNECQQINIGNSPLYSTEFLTALRLASERVLFDNDDNDDNDDNEVNDDNDDNEVNDDNEMNDDNDDNEVNDDDDDDDDNDNDNDDNDNDDNDDDGEDNNNRTVNMVPEYDEVNVDVGNRENNSDITYEQESDHIEEEESDAKEVDENENILKNDTVRESLLTEEEDKDRLRIPKSTHDKVFNIPDNHYLHESSVVY